MIEYINLRKGIKMENWTGVEVGILGIVIGNLILTWCNLALIIHFGKEKEGRKKRW